MGREERSLAPPMSVRSGTPFLHDSRSTCQSPSPARFTCIYRPCDCIGKEASGPNAYCAESLDFQEFMQDSQFLTELQASSRACRPWRGCVMCRISISTTLSKDNEMRRLESNRSVIKVLYLLLLSLDPASQGLAVEDVWTSKADMPTARGFVSGCVLEGKIYVIGGFPIPIL